MSVVFVCGVDLEENRPNVSSLNGSGSYSLSFAQQIGTRTETGPGQNEGGGAFYKRYGWSLGSEQFGSALSARLYFWIRRTGASSGGFRNIFGLEKTGHTWGVGMNGAGQFRLIYNDGSGVPTIDGNETLYASEASVYTLPVNEWLPIELSVDSNGVIELWVGGNAVLGFASTVVPPSTQWNCRLENYDETIGIDYDHIVCTLGPRLQGPGLLHCVLPTGTFSGSTTGTHRGLLVKDGVSYRSGSDPNMMRGMFPGNTDMPLQGAGKAAGTGYAYFACNPETGDPWGSYEDFLQAGWSWGICTWPQGLAGALARLHAACLSVVVTDPFVRVLTLPPAGLTHLSGTWRKSNPDLPVFGHIYDKPRIFQPDEEDLYIETEERGCVVFEVTETVPLATSGVTFAEERRDDLLDWVDVSNENLSYDSYFMSGFNVLGEGNKDFQSNYVTVQYEPVPEGAAYIQGAWDYSLSGSTGRWGTRQQVYRLSEPGYYAKMAKLKIRGRGKALQLRVESEDNHPFSISGWSISASSNGSV